MAVARKPRVHYEGAFYHVIVRGNNREYIFKNERAKEMYLEKVRKYIEKYEGKLYAYVLMDNHCHMLIEVSSAPLSKIMQLIQQTYTAWYNRKYKHTGHVFEQRFKSILCDKDAYLLSLVKYIHQNPVRAKIGGLDYKYSSHRDYVEGNNDLCEVDFVLSIFSDKKKKAIKLYQAFMEVDDDVISNKKEADLSPEFEEIEVEINNSSFIKKDIAEIRLHFENKHSIEIEQLKGKYLKHHLIGLRKEYIKEVLKYKAMKQRELSQYFRITESQVSRIYNSTK